MYCGNNKLKAVNNLTDEELRYNCLRQGVGAGLNQTGPNEIYIPIKNYPMLFCGKSKILPNGYTDFGSPSQCLVKGYGVGKRLKTEKYLDSLIEKVRLLISEYN